VESGGGSATLTVRVKNAGTAGASDFWVDVFLDPLADPVPGSLGEYYTQVAYADAGEEVELSFTIDGRAGDHEIWVVADIDDTIAESNENDNSHHATYPFEIEPAGPNLTITWFDYYADATEIFYVIDVYNGGSEDVGQFYVDLWIDSVTDPTGGFVGDEFRDFEGLAKGQTAYVDFVIPVSGLDASMNGCASCTSWVKVDTNDNVAETDETDNVAGPIEVEVP
jgi:subtilase family serine protease